MARPWSSRGDSHAALHPRPESLDAAGKAVTLGGWVRPDQGSGVIAAFGGQIRGVSLYLEDRVPHFALRVDRRLATVQASERIAKDEWTHLCGRLTRDGEMRLLVNGRRVASKDAVLLKRTPHDGVTVGADPVARVTRHADAFHYDGAIGDLRFYFGPISRSQLMAWARPRQQAKERSAENQTTKGVDSDLIVSNGTRSEVLRFGGSDGSYKGMFATKGLGSPYGQALGPGGDMYVSSAGTGEVVRFDGTDGSFKGVFARADELKSPRGLTFVPSPASRIPLEPRGGGKPEPMKAPVSTERAKKLQQRWAEHHGMPVERTNSLGMKLAFIPRGRYKRGSRWSTDRLEERYGGDFPYRYRQERPRHRVKLTHGFYMGVMEVTQAQYERVMGQEPNWGHNEEGDNRPAVAINWQAAAMFCEKLSEKTGGEYRLPTEAEWEYACRAGSQTAYHFGNDSKELGRYAWYRANNGGHIHRVGQKEPNAWGLHDMHANASEWCANRVGDYPDHPVTDPPGADSGDKFVIRGGSYTDIAGHCRSTSRMWIPARTERVGNGFRVVMELERGERSGGESRNREQVQGRATKTTELDRSERPTTARRKRVRKLLEHQARRTRQQRQLLNRQAALLNEAREPRDRHRELFLQRMRDGLREHASRLRDMADSVAGRNPAEYLALAPKSTLFVHAARNNNRDGPLYFDAITRNGRIVESFEEGVAAWRGRARSEGEVDVWGVNEKPEHVRHGERSAHLRHTAQSDGKGHSRGTFFRHLKAMPEPLRSFGFWVKTTNKPHDDVEFGLAAGGKMVDGRSEGDPLWGRVRNAGLISFDLHHDARGTVHIRSNGGRPDDLRFRIEPGTWYHFTVHRFRLGIGWAEYRIEDESGEVKARGRIEFKPLAR